MPEHNSGVVSFIEMSNQQELLATSPGNFLYRRKGMVPHVMLSTNCGLGCFRNKTKCFLHTDSQFFGELTTAQEVDVRPVYISLDPLN
jgi:hypothetical protein